GREGGAQERDQLKRGDIADDVDRRAVRDHDETRRDKGREPADDRAELVSQGGAAVSDLRTEELAEESGLGTVHGRVDQCETENQGEIDEPGLTGVHQGEEWDGEDDRARGAGAEDVA